MAIIYDGSARSAGGTICLARMNGTATYLRHYENKLYLRFIAANGTRNERWQAEKELKICERKLGFWEKHPNFIGEEARRGMEKLNNNWKGGDTR